MIGISRNVRTDSKSIALLAIFSAMVVALEVYPIVGVTDLKFQTGAAPFTIDWTGIPIVLIFVGLGFVYSLVAIAMMFIGIGYRNVPGAIFKSCAEFFTVLGLVITRYLIRDRDVDFKYQLLLYCITSLLFRGVGMFFTNIILLPIFYPLYYGTIEVVITTSSILVPWNILQAIINVVGGIVFYRFIPENLKQEAGLGEHHVREGLRELDEDEIDTS
ncbi:MAG: hypothetical protein GF411_09340 [Candidatus Lokiarchaeota archaeon]|nr:hypothetical protein [Candidatus Lokiarchaeota archaeon]